MLFLFSMTINLLPSCLVVV